MKIQNNAVTDPMFADDPPREFIALAEQMKAEAELESNFHEQLGAQEKQNVELAEAARAFDELPSPENAKRLQGLRQQRAVMRSDTSDTIAVRYERFAAGKLRRVVPLLKAALNAKLARLESELTDVTKQKQGIVSRLLRKEVAAEANDEISLALRYAIMRTQRQLERLPSLTNHSLARCCAFVLAGDKRPMSPRDRWQLLGAKAGAELAKEFAPLTGFAVAAQRQAEFDRIHEAEAERREPFFTDGQGVSHFALSR